MLPDFIALWSNPTPEACAFETVYRVVVISIDELQKTEKSFLLPEIVLEQQIHFGIVVKLCVYHTVHTIHI